jgi:hypothetical protein
MRPLSIVRRVAACLSCLAATLIVSGGHAAEAGKPLNKPL